MEKIYDSIQSSFEKLDNLEKHNLIETELKKSINNSLNSIEIIRILLLSKESVDVPLLQNALSKICYLQENLDEIRDRQLAEFKEYKHVFDFVFFTLFLNIFEFL